MIEKHPSLVIRTRNSSGQEFELEIRASLLRWILLMLLIVVELARGVPVDRIIPRLGCHGMHSASHVQNGDRVLRQSDEFRRVGATSFAKAGDEFRHEDRPEAEGHSCVVAQATSFAKCRR